MVGNDKTSQSFFGILGLGWGINGTIWPTSANSQIALIQLLSNSTRHLVLHVCSNIPGNIFLATQDHPALGEAWMEPPANLAQVDRCLENFPPNNKTNENDRYFSCSGSEVRNGDLMS